MYYQREWKSRRNAAGFAAECARLALPFYEGDHKPDLVATIEVAERYASSGSFRRARTTKAIVAARVAKRAADGVCAARAARAAERAAGAVTDDDYNYNATYAAHWASLTGADDHEIRVACARWVVRDLSGGRELPAELRQAAGAAVVAGDEDLAEELLA